MEEKLDNLCQKVRYELSLVKKWDLGHEKTKGLLSAFFKPPASLIHKEKDIKIIRLIRFDDYVCFKYQVILNGETLVLYDLDDEFVNVLNSLSGKTQRDNDKIDRQLKCLENSDHD